MNSLKQLKEYGQSVWLDYIRRSLITGGGLTRMIEQDGVSGVTSNPAIFEKAIAGSGDYSAVIRDLARTGVEDPRVVFERLAVEDIQRAADELMPMYRASEGRDGYVSFEVSPRLANDTDGTVDEARRLWEDVGRANLMIKVPATPAGFPAVEALLGAGINVNVTLLFSRQVYRRAMESFIRGLERRAAAGGDVSRVASVASLFVSRIDTAVDRLIDQRLEETHEAALCDRLTALKGRVAVANAKLAYQDFRSAFSGERWDALEVRGARVQRLLWASTGTKNPAYSDVLYVEPLIGPDTVNTLPPATMDAFREHGVARSSVEEGVDEARAVLDALAREGISLEQVTDRLLREGLDQFTVAFDKLLDAVAGALGASLRPRIDSHSHSLPDDIGDAVEAALDDWERNDKVRRLWARDASLWTGGDEARWMDWLDITCEQIEHLGDLRRLGHLAEGRYFTHAVLMGMGGSSLAPEVFRETFGTFPDHPDLLVLDSTDPAQIRTVEGRIDLSRTAFIVASKSGSTLEPNIMLAYFLDRASEAVGEAQAANHFGAITDPGSDLERFARQRGFRKIFHGKHAIGGRYSALSNFGLVPAAVMGIDVARLLDSATEMVEACAACVPARHNPGVMLGIVLGEAALCGRDKLTIVASPGIGSLGAWLEQLVAESTGKQGKGIIPVDGEGLAAPETYGDDRLFVYLCLEDGIDEAQETAVAALETAGHAVVRIAIADIHDIGQEMFRWEIATAVAGSVLGINPFDQPDVEASKVETRKLTQAYEQTGEFPRQAPLVAGEGLTLFTDDANARALRDLAGGGAVADIVAAHLGRIVAGDYFAVLGYLDRLNPAHGELMQAIRERVRDAFGVATCLGFGPRFLHSTGQAYKGGPNSGVFLQITCDEAQDLQVPGHRYTFGVVKAAQAMGDFQVLADRGRRALRVHLGADTVSGLQTLRELVGRALDGG